MTANMKELLQHGMNQNEEVRNVFVNGPDHFFGRDPESSEPLMGIVKDWLEEEDPEWTFHEWVSPAKYYPRMLRDLRELHRCGVVVRDMKGDQ